MKKFEIQFLFLLFILLLPGLCFSVTFESSYGGYHYQKGYAVRFTSDSGYAVVGTSGLSIYFVKTDSFGDTLWTKTHYYGGYAHIDVGYSFQNLPDGEYIIVGYKDSTYSSPPPYPDLRLIRTDSSGDTIWTRLYGGDSLDIGYWIEITPDSCFIIVGETKSYGQGNSDVWLIKTDTLGNILWSQTYGGASYDMGRVVKNTPDGGFIIVGSTYSFGNGFRDIYLIKTDPLGNLIWQKTYGGSEYDQGHDIEITADKGYIIVGQTNSFGFGAQDIYFIKTDSLGDTLWTRTYGGSFDDVGYSVANTYDGGHIIAGYTDSYGAGNGDVYLIKVDSLGNPLWNRTFGGVKEDCAYAVEEVWDRGFIITGYTYSSPNDTLYSDLYLIKTDSLGNVEVEEEIASQIRNRGLSLTCHPNPFSDKATIEYRLGLSVLNESNEIELKIFDISGRLIKRFGNLGNKSFNQVIWDRKNDSGNIVPNGIYFLQIEAQSETKTEKIIILK